MWPNPQFSEGLVTFTEGILIGKLPFFVQCKCKNEKLLETELETNIDTLEDDLLMKTIKNFNNLFVTKDFIDS